jgi:hypothetical protein
MNEVETYLRQSGKWQVPIATDWLGRATKGTWWPTYYAQWLDAHAVERVKRDPRKFGPGGWARGDDGKDRWITDTPEWDKKWFRARGVRPPKRFGEKSRTYWKDYGDGLQGLSYGDPRT